LPLIGAQEGQFQVLGIGVVLRGYATVEVPSMRMVVDLSNLDNSRWIQLTGESGHAFSAHYHDQFDLWRTGGTLPMRWDQAAITREARDTQRFTG